MTPEFPNDKCNPKETMYEREGLGRLKPSSLK